MTQFEAVVDYAGTRVKVKSDSFEELHTALAGIEELNQDAAFLKEEKAVADVVPVHRRDEDENDYFGLQDRSSRKNVTYGKKRGEAVVPFFPKGADGYYDPDAMGTRRRARGDRYTSQGDDQQRAQERRSDRRHARRQRDEPSRASSPASSDDLPF